MNINKPSLQLQKGISNRKYGSLRKVFAASMVTSALVSTMMVPQAFAEPIEEVIVTSQKRVQNLQDVSLSITVLSGKHLADLRIQQPADIGHFTPGLYVTTSNTGDPIFALRGIGMNNGESNQNPAVTPYIDEVALPSIAMMGFQLFDLERVEVLKGPQGTLYGRNVTGGAINFVTKKPTHEFDASARMDYGRFDLVEFEAAIGGSLSDTLAARIAVKSVTRDGWQTLMLGPDAGPVDENNGAIDRQSGRLSVLWTPNDNFDMLLVADAGFSSSEVLGYEHAGNLLHDRSGLCSYGATGIRNENECASFAIRRDSVGGNPVTGDVELVSDTDNDPRTVFASFSYGNIDKVDSWGFNNTMNLSMGRTTLTSVTGYRTLDRETGGDNGSPFIVSDTFSVKSIKMFSQEVRLASDETWDGLQWIVGAYYSKDKVDDLILFNYRDHTSFSGLFDSTFYQETRDIAVFANAEWTLSDTVKLVGGLRYTDEFKQFSYDGHNEGTGPVPVVGYIAEVSDTEITGKIGVDYTPTDDLLLYASFSRGFKGPGFPATISFGENQLAPFEAEELLAYEVGVKSTLAEGRVQLNAAGYYYDWRDMQATTAVTREGIRLIVLANAGNARIYGLEAEATWHVTDEFSIRAGLNWISAEITTGEFEGDTPVQTPKFSTSVIARYQSETPVAGVLPFLQADFSYRTKVELALANNHAEVQEGYALLGMRMGVKSEDDQWELSAWVRNLTDTLYKSSSFGAGSGFLPGRRMYAEPRMFGVSLNYRY
ncbi:MAG: hypothetical protein COB36_10140 [Alphaproteobacteria bacterium]|nr:MAG: hypothetical protein COB36_10140 [Alphaproteobacteria bacterium]